MPAVPAAPLDTDIWARVQRALLDPANLSDGLAAAREAHTVSQQRRQTRLDTLDRELERLRGRLTRITAERLDAEPVSETARALRALADETEGALNRLVAERAELAAQPVAGLAPEDAAALEAFAGEIRAGLENATPADRRRVYALLRLQGRVREDQENGVKLARKHRFGVDWEAVLELCSGSSEVKKVRVSYFTDDYAEWERENLGEVKINLDAIPTLEVVARVRASRRQPRVGRRTLEERAIWRARSGTWQGHATDRVAYPTVRRCADWYHSLSTLLWFGPRRCSSVWLVPAGQSSCVGNVPYYSSPRTLAPHTFRAVAGETAVLRLLDLASGPAPAAGANSAVRKGFAGGTHRAVAPEATLDRLQPHLPAMGITRVANLTGLDRIGVPTVAAYRPNSRALAVSMGKGLTLAAAKASALMEAAETWHAERLTLPVKLCGFVELCEAHRVVDVDGLPRASQSVYHPRLPLLWSEGVDLLGDETVWLPHELVHTNYTWPPPAGSGCFLASSNGLASGNHLLEAISHAICEVVERDAQTLWELLDEPARAATRVDLATVDDPACRAVLDHFERAGVAVGVWETTSDIGIPAFTCLIAERTADPFRPLHSGDGAGCHPAREVALLRALTEAAQTRLSGISGARDTLTREIYARMRHPDRQARERARLAPQPGGRSFAAAPTFQAPTFDADVAWELQRLRAVGIEQVVAVDLTRPDLGLAVVRVVIPGLEAWLGAGDYRPGPRARRLVKE